MQIIVVLVLRRLMKTFKNKTKKTTTFKLKSFLTFLNILSLEMGRGVYYCMHIWIKAVCKKKIYIYNFYSYNKQLG